MLLNQPPELQGLLFGPQQQMAWDLQLLSPVHPTPPSHHSPVQDLVGSFLSLALFQPFLLVSSLWILAKRWEGEEKREEKDVPINERGM